MTRTFQPVRDAAHGLEVRVIGNIYYGVVAGAVALAALSPDALMAKIRYR